MPLLQTRPLPSTWVHLAAAVALTAIATPLAYVAHEHVPGAGTEVLLIAVVLSAVVGGLPSALLATLLAAVSLDLFVVPPRFQFELGDPSHWLHIGVFLLTGLVVSSLYSAMRRSKLHERQLLDGERESKQQLERLTAELRDANEVKDEFIGLVSHELKTPLTTIIMNAHYLRRTSNAGVQSDGAVVIDELETEAHRLASIVDNLLALARLDRGVPLILEPVAVARIVKRVVMRHQVEHPEREFALSLDTRVVAEASSVSLEQVVHNLISNAEKYSPQGQPVSVRVLPSGGHALLEVSDSGPGVPAGDIAHVFEPFYRSQTTASRAAGLGIGLAVCKRLIEAESGRIWLDQADGRTTFRVALPLSAEAGSKPVTSIRSADGSPARVPSAN